MKIMYNEGGQFKLLYLDLTLKFPSTFSCYVVAIYLQDISTPHTQYSARIVIS